jgi:hypothetical protein
MSRRRSSRPAALAALLVVLLALLGTPASGAGEPAPIEDYPSYQPASRCSPDAKPGTVMLGRWIVRKYGGGFGGISRRCSRGSTSEHYEGRAFDWTVSASRRADRRRVRAFLADLLATDKAGNEHARARRMGVMYVIWDDHMYSAWDHYTAEPYRSSSCPRLRTCSATLRHRDHLHISLTRRAARAETSWYLRRG